MNIFDLLQRSFTDVLCLRHPLQLLLLLSSGNVGFFYLPYLSSYLILHLERAQIMVHILHFFKHAGLFSFQKEFIQFCESSDIISFQSVQEGLAQDCLHCFRYLLLNFDRKVYVDKSLYWLGAYQTVICHFLGGCVWISHLRQFLVELTFIAFENVQISYSFCMIWDAEVDAFYLAVQCFKINLQGILYFSQITYLELLTGQLIERPPIFTP